MFFEYSSGNIFGNWIGRALSLRGIVTLAVALSACGPVEDAANGSADVDVGRHSDALQSRTVDAGCGYTISSGAYAVSRNGYHGWVRLTNVSGERARSFRVFLDTSGTRLVDADGAELTERAGGYVASSPASLARRTIARGQSYRFEFSGRGKLDDVSASLLSVNGSACETTAPTLELTASRAFVSSAGSVTLSADASDDTALRRVVFFEDGAIIGERVRPPYSISIELSAADNGRHHYSATAVDLSGNRTNDTASVLVAIDDRFVGSSVGHDSDYTYWPDVFNQVTPENAGKWGSVEPTRDEMNWAELDRAYEFAKSHGYVFKLHTLVWGQQEPTWLSALSDEEKVEELDEWMQLLAERYPDIDLVDVVNEPLHTPPSYKDALGGDGETGWDWVIRAFEMARVHFPHSELILNEYQTLMNETFTESMVEIVDVLAQRELIDGIGEQGHFLERTDTAIVEQNLATLAATGFPIYISEFDVNLANDAQQANRLRDLFTVFMNNPSVLGVTFWVFLEGNTWRKDAYLLHSDGSPRPAFDWLSCTLAGRSDCTVPDYVPAPRVGTENGITLQAEEYDAGYGVDALGDIIAYTDDGDWTSYGPIEFQDSWDTFSITYSKGNEEPGSISIHLDSLDAEPLVTADLPPTGDWGASKTLELPWTPISGLHTVYLRFHGTTGVANVDRLRFGIPTPTGPGANLVSNPDFEIGTDGWFGWGGTLGISTDRAHGGAQSLVVTDRTEGAGTAAYDLTSVVAAGGIYPTSAFVSIGGAATADIHITAKVSCSGQSDSYTWLASGTATDGEWTELDGSLTVPDCDLTQVLIYVEGPPAGVDVYVDDVFVTAE